MGSIALGCVLKLCLHSNCFYKVYWVLWGTGHWCLSPHPVPTLALPLLCLWHLETQLGEGKWLFSQCGLHPPPPGGQWCCGSLFAASCLHFEKHSFSSWSFPSIPFPSEGRAHLHQTFHPDIQATFLRTSSIPGMEERLLDWESSQMF